MRCQSAMRASRFSPASRKCKTVNRAADLKEFACPGNLTRRNNIIRDVIVRPRAGVYSRVGSAEGAPMKPLVKQGLAGLTAILLFAGLALASPQAPQTPQPQ